VPLRHRVTRLNLSTTTAPVRRLITLAVITLVVGTFAIAEPISASPVASTAPATETIAEPASVHLTVTQLVASDGSAVSPAAGFTPVGQAPARAQHAAPAPPAAANPAPVKSAQPTQQVKQATKSSTPAGYGCAAALAYLSAHAAPGFTFECPGYAMGRQAMTCVNHAPECAGRKIIAIAVPCAAAYMNEAHNSWVLTGTGSGIDPYGYCH
jgi:hypothetical protein